VATLTLNAVNKTFEKTHVIRGVNLEVAHGEFVVFVGPSGCGKSTLLRIIAGLETASEGEVRIDNAVVNDVSAADRGCAMVFQSYALYPHMSVFANMAFGLENMGTPQATIDQKVNEAAKLLKLDALLQRKPTQLSGGQRQRVAIGRAIVREPKIFLFDEPLSNLDAELRVSMRSELRDLHARLGATMIYVTHDQVEAMTLADRIVVLKDGKIEQVGTPQSLYQLPCNAFVAGFIGSPRMNFLATDMVRAAAPALLANTQAGASLGIRPEHLTLAERGEGLPATIASVEYLGGTNLLHGTLPDGGKIEALLDGTIALQRGSPVSLGFAPANAHHFDAAGARI
jgi:multiple sugar transport system ATP-binding protein